MTAGAGRRLVPWVLLLGVLVIVAVMSQSTSGSGRRLDPRSTGLDGARGLVLLLEALDADVDVERGAPSGHDVALVLDDRLDDDDRRAALAWVAEGHVLVVADPSSPLLQPLFVDPAAFGPCPAALSTVDAVDLGDNGGVRRASPDACLSGLVAVADHGAGTLVGIETPAPFTNDLLDARDNAVLAANLLAPAPGAEVVIIDGPLGGGSQSLSDLIAPSIRQAGLQLLVAFALYVLWRGRRLGRPIVESQPVAIAGSELVAAVGRLLDARDRPDEAAESLRTDVRRSLEVRLGLPAGADTAAVADAVAARTGLDPSGVADAIATRPIATAADLVALTDDLDRIRRAALGN